MKRFLSTFIIACLLLGSTFSSASRSQAATSGKVTTFSDGSYCVESFTVKNTGISTYSTTSTTVGTKTAKYYDASGTLCWKYELTATFRVNNGVSATCISCSDQVTRYIAAWTYVSKSAAKSGNKATGTVKMKNNGKTATKTITITCNKSGVIK